MPQAASIHGIEKPTRRALIRALKLSGAGSQSSWIRTKIRLAIREAQKQFGGDIFSVLTDEERDILQIVASGAAELQHIAEEALLTESRIKKVLADLMDCGYVEERRKGGKTEQARGAAIKYYFVTSKYRDA